MLDCLTLDEFTVLEKVARARVIAETVDPVRQLAKDGKAWTSVKPMMRRMLSENTFGETADGEEQGKL